MSDKAHPSGMTSEQLAEAGRKGSSARKKRSNQWIKRREELDLELLRAQIPADELLDMLYKDASGKRRIEAGQRASAEILLNKALPNLQAVEQTQAQAPQSEQELLAAFAEHLRSDPGLRAQLQALLSGAPTPVNGSDSSQEAA